MTSRDALLARISAAGFLSVQFCATLGDAALQGTPEHALVLSVGMVLSTVTMVAWVHFDASAREYVLTPALKATIIFASIIGVPLYIWRSRPTRRAALVSTAWLVAIIALAAGAGALGEAIGELTAPT